LFLIIIIEQAKDSGESSTDRSIHHRNWEYLELCQSRELSSTRFRELGEVMKTGPIELQEIVEALSCLGGQARSVHIINKVTEIRGGIPIQYKSRESYGQTIQKKIQEHCPQSEIWKPSNSDVFTKVKRGVYKLTNSTNTDSFSSLKIQVIADLESISQEDSADLESISQEDSKIEGGMTKRLVNHFERNPKLRTDAISLHGTSCKACGFNFEAIYGEHGKNYIEVHHLVPISTLTDPTSISAKDDMTVLCSNCHRMIHRKKNSPMSVSDLSALISKDPRV
jgi:hypothetical protein